MGTQPSNQVRPLAILLMGPTASGKSALALELTQYFPLEIVSVDSGQIYRRMDIGTAKPDVETQAQVPHHLLDIIDPDESYSAARFRADALQAMDAIARRGRVPILVGGTMLYFKALREGLNALPEADAQIRAAIEQEAQQSGWPALHAQLRQVDPVTAARLEMTDAQRIQRALEVYRLTGKPLSALLSEAHSGRSEIEARYRLLPLALTCADRSALHARIAERFDAMLQAGLIDEVRALRARYRLAPQMPSMRCVGYRQVWTHLEGEYAHAELRDRGIFATRQLAKRQLTWLRQTEAEFFDYLDARLLEKVRDRIAGRAL